MGNSTFLQIPNDVDDPVILRRVLENLVRAIDEIRGDRGEDASASQSQLVSTATSLDELIKDFNSLDNEFLRKDGKNKATAPISYLKKFDLSGSNLVDADYVTSYFTGGYLDLDTQTAPDLLDGEDHNDIMSAKIDEIIEVLKLTKLLV